MYNIEYSPFALKYNMKNPYFSGFEELTNNKQEALERIWYQYEHERDYAERAWAEATDNIPDWDDGYEYDYICDSCGVTLDHDDSKVCDCDDYEKVIIGGELRPNRFYNPELTYNRMVMKLEKDYPVLMDKTRVLYRMYT